MSNELSERCSVIEECYEFMLAYAGQGLAGEGDGSAQGGLIRDFLGRAAQALAGLETAYASDVVKRGMGPSAPYAAFQAVLARDTQDSLAAVELVLAQSVISSQLIDNLNASIHLRALLTDLFLIDEILKGSQNAGSQNQESPASSGQ